MDINTLDLKERYTEIKDIVIRHIRGDKKDVALVLSSGGARGLAHIGAIEELLERGYNIRSIAGTSMGALVAGMYATGHLDRFKEWMETIDRKKIFSLTDFSLSFDHLVKGRRIITALKEIVPDVRIEDLPIPYAAVATDWESGHEVVFTQGSLYDAIRASISLPAFLSPVKTGNKTLIDGGITNPLPLNRVAPRATCWWRSTSADTTIWDRRASKKPPKSTNWKTRAPCDCSSASCPTTCIPSLTCTRCSTARPLS